MRHLALLLLSVLVACSVESLPSLERACDADHACASGWECVNQWCARLSSAGGGAANGGGLTGGGPADGAATGGDGGKGATCVSEFERCDGVDNDCDGAVDDLLFCAASASTGAPASVDGSATAARFAAPTHVAVDAAGNAYVYEAGTAALRKITRAGQVTTLCASGPGSGDGQCGDVEFSPTAMAWSDARGLLYFASSGAQVRALNPATLAITTVTTSTSASPILGMAVAPTGDLVFTQPGEAWRLPVVDGGAIVRSASSGGARWDRVAVDALDNIYLLDLAHQQLVIAPRNGGLRALATFTEPVVDISWVGAPDAGGIGVLLAHPRVMAIIDAVLPDGGTTRLRSLPATPSANIGYHQGLHSTVALAGNGASAWVLGTDHVVRDVSNSMVVGYQPSVDGPQSQARVTFPTGVAALDDGTIAFTEPTTHSVRMFSPDGGYRTLIGNLASPRYGNREGSFADALVTSPTDVVARGHQLFVADWDNGRVRVLDLSTATMSTLPASVRSGADFVYPYFLALGRSTAQAEVLITVDPENRCIWELPLGSGPAVQLHCATADPLSWPGTRPVGLTTDADGNWWVGFEGALLTGGPARAVTTFATPLPPSYKLTGLGSAGGSQVLMFDLALLICRLPSNGTSPTNGDCSSVVAFEHGMTRSNAYRLVDAALHDQTLWFVDSVGNRLRAQELPR